MAFRPSLSSKVPATSSSASTRSSAFLIRRSSAATLTTTSCFRVWATFRQVARVDGQLRVLDNLWPFWECVIISTLGFSGIRLRNARPRR
ncbi:DUF6886 family protein [Phytohabitans aurantiacus]|uniref:DUF6886 family protein n=1 Tax=Phytohabitans aurantiacus TaxID=3016789 RepID=UPI00389A5064